MVAPNQIHNTDTPAPGALEPLSQEESRFLSQFFRDFKEDLFAWSAATDIDLDVLAKWLNHPKIAAYVAALRHHQAQAAKRRCIDLLTTIVDSDEPLPEKRRAATTLLRAIAPAGRAPRRAARDTPDPAPAHQSRLADHHHQATAATNSVATHTAAQQSATSARTAASHHPATHNHQPAANNPARTASG